MKVTSQKNETTASREKIFGLVSNCKNFAGFLPSQMQDVEITEDSCSFSIPGITRLILSIVKKTEFEEVCYQANNDKNIPVNIAISITEESVSTNAISVEVDLDVPIFLAGMVKTPLQNFVDMIAPKIKEAAEKA